MNVRSGASRSVFLQCLRRTSAVVRRCSCSFLPNTQQGADLYYSMLSVVLADDGYAKPPAFVKQHKSEDIRFQHIDS